MSTPAPRELRLSPARDRLTLVLDSGETLALTAEYLRVESPSAEVQGHGPSQKRAVPGKREVTITAIEPVGNYAVRLIFSDGHDSGLFSWTWLRHLADNHATLWPAYLAALDAAGLDRG